ncbi:MAG TPA: 50S ribosomal protein L11 methyltransferase [Firmicutes bacterium]|nr:50S ribosomal protein L11 methyltransferase [Bacillota bacterium]
MRIVINRTALEGAYAVLSKWGIDSFAVEDSDLMDQAQRLGWGDYFPDVEPSEQATIICYLAEDRLSKDQQEELRRDLLNLREFGFDPGPLVVSEGQVQEEDWAHAWKAYYHPLRIGQVLIQPAWEALERDPGPGQIVVELDPGMAFGTGTHPSTAMCIELLQHLNLEGRLVWDIGTGSGILAIVAAKLGAQVEAVDIDAVAVRAAKENRDLNGLSFPVSQGTLENLQGGPQVIVANIVAHVILPMLPEVQRVLSPKGYFIASGVIMERDGEILSAAKEAGLRLLRRKEQGEWAAYLFQRGD